jgi:hypothetical protein
MVEQIHTWNLQTEGHHHIHARLRDLDRDGAAGEIVFHGSAPFQPIPFMMSYVGSSIADPQLKLVQTEQIGDWFGRVAAELDSRWETWDHLVREHVPQRPNVYCRNNYFVGASFQSRAEAEAAIRDGYDDNVLWGSDYPHPEGTFRFQADPTATPVTRLAMRNTYAGLPASPVRKMLGENAVRAYGFDSIALQVVADRINAPTLAELSQPIDAPPSHWGLAFRTSAFYS